MMPQPVIQHSYMIFTAFQLICEGRSLQIVGRQNLLVSQELVDVTTVVQDNSVSNSITSRVIDAATQDVSIFVLDML